MNHCPGCGAETDPHMTACWECHEPLKSSRAAKDDLAFGPEDDDLLEAAPSENDKSPTANRAATQTRHSAARLDHTADALLAAAGGTNTEIPATAVVAFVAQDEVQAGTISQLLTDCGIHNFASAKSDSPDNNGGAEILQVQVLQEDLAAARQVIEDFTAEFDDFT